MAEYIIDEEELASVEPPIYPEKDYEFPERIVRCKDCRHYGYCRFFRTKNNKPHGFCAWGERKEK